MSGAEPATMADETSRPSAESLIPEFKLIRLLNQDQAGRRTILHGTIRSQPGLLILERAPFPTSTNDLSVLPSTLRTLQNLGDNDIYRWYMATSGDAQPPDLKLNLIWPCTEKHIAKYSPQKMRSVTETPAVYLEKVRPYMQKQRDEGRLNWIFNILEGRTEQEDVLYREGFGNEDVGDEGFLLLPDLNWDRKTLGGLHLLGLVERRDIWSLRDLGRGHVEWLKHMRDRLVSATVQMYPSVEKDELKLYVHYQPTYYHFHIHVVHTALDAGTTQAVGKAFGLDNLISQLECMAEGKGMADVSLTYTLGEASQLWSEIFLPLREARSTN